MQLGSYERKNRNGKATKTVYYSYWLDENDIGKDGNPKRKKHYYKKPYPAVIIEHKQRMDGLSGKNPSLLITGERKDKFEIIYESWKYDGAEPDGTPKLIEHDDSIRATIPKHIFLANVRKFLSNPVKAAEELGAGWEQVRKLKDLPIHEDKVSLQELFEFYLERKNPCGQEKRGQKSAWKFFQKIIGKNFISEVSERDIADFNVKTRREANSRKGVSNQVSWVRTKFMKIKTVLNTCKKYLIPQNDDVARVIEYWERHINDVPDPEVTDKPKAIPMNEFIILAENSNLKFKTIYHMAVNCFYYAGDFPFLKKEYILNHNGSTFIRMPRNKQQRRFERLNCLAPETIELLNDYMETEPNDTEYVFNGEKSNGKPNGRPISSKGIRTYHKKLCAELKVKGVGFRHCRDAVTHIRKLHPDIQNLSLGHKVSDEERVKYIEDMIEDSIEPMEIIRKMYFLS